MLVYVYIVIGFIILIKGASFLVEGATSVARKFKVPDLVIGLTIVAFGTSAPELFVNVISSVKGNPALAIGNILGSNIANILLVLGLAALIRPLEVGKGTVWKEIPFLFFTSLLLGFLANDIIFFKNSNSFIGRVDGLVFLGFFILFMIYSFKIAKPSYMSEEVPEKEYSVGKSVFLMFIGLIGLSLGGKFIVDSAIEIARRFGMEDVLIGLTVVAIGTTLPEIATSVVAAYKKKMDIAIGNVVGSNIFNILFVLGISSIIKPIPFYSVENISMLIVILASLLLFVTMFTLKKNKLDRWEGAIFLLLYAGYLAYLIFQR